MLGIWTYRFQRLLTHFMPLVSFHGSWRDRKTFWFPDVFRVYIKRPAVWTGYLVNSKCCHHMETIPLRCILNQLIGFNMIVVNGLTAQNCLLISVNLFSGRFFKCLYYWNRDLSFWLKFSKIFRDTILSGMVLVDHLENK